MTITQTDSTHKLTLPNFDFEVNQQLTPLLELLKVQKSEIDRIAMQDVAPTWENTMAPLEVNDDRLSQFWSPISICMVWNFSNTRIV